MVKYEMSKLASGTVCQRLICEGGIELRLKFAVKAKNIAIDHFLGRLSVVEI
jgi:hypothetical protein